MNRRRLWVAVPLLLCILTLGLGSVFMKDVLAADKNIYTELTLFNRVLNLITTYYVEEMQADSLIQGAIEGMLDELDPHSNYIEPDRFDRMEERNRGSYSGIGISFAIMNDWLTVISAMEGGPSIKLGIRAGDVITHIEGESAYGIKEQEVFDKLRGPKGTEVKVTVRRSGEPEPIPYTIVRDDVLIESVPYAFMLEPGIGYIRMGRFSATTSEELERALVALESQGMESLILDLRGNSGGYLTQAIEVSDKFIGGGKKIVYTQGRIFGSSEEYFATNDATHPDIPIVVLINAGSASASEIVSGAIQDWDRGLVVGSTSFGKGLVQRQYPLPNGGALLLTVARYYTPCGRLIQRPYEAGGRDDYYRQAGRLNHPDLGDEEDAGEAQEGAFDEASASGQEAPSPAPPVYTTLLQNRNVTGGGGIVPDVEIDELYRTSRLNGQLTFDRKYFEYATRAIGEGKASWEGSFEDFVEQFLIGDDLLEGLQAYLEADSFSFEPDTFAVHADEIRRGLRAEFANHFWGDNERYRILIEDDPAIARAMQYIPQARDLLEESRRIEAQRASRDH
jgi:carboxyl-terminal processing protease